MSLRIAPLVAVWLATAINALAALSIGNPVWGFDGQFVAAGTFNIVSVEVRNTGAAAFDGELVLDDGGAFGSRNSAAYRQKIFLAPGTARWVQFYPYIGNSVGDWRLVWEEKGREAKETANSESLKTGPPAVVILADPESPTKSNARMRLFNEANFPPTVAATDALHAVILDHQPRWDVARKEAFLDWLKRGGIIHMLPGPDGAMPVFTDELLPLNNAGPVGAGRIIHHKFSRAEITEKDLLEAGFPPPEFKTNNSEQYDYFDTNDNGYFETLASVTKPNIAWWLIYLLTAVYIVLIGPVFYLLRKRDYRILLGGFLATVAIFAWIFTVVGRRGYGEKQIYHSLAVARSIEGGKWDVRHFVHAFATSGDLYKLSYPGTTQLFAAPSRSGETVRGSVAHGKDAHLEADIPLFSARAFIHRGVMPGPDFGFKITSFETEKSGGNLRALTLSAVGPLPDEIIKIGVQYNKGFYRLTRRGAVFELQGQSVTLSQSLGDGTDQSNHYRYGYGYNQNAERAASDLRTSFAAHLAHEVSDDSTTRKPLSSRVPPDGTVRLFMYAAAPPSFRMSSTQFTPGHEYVLYVADLSVPGK
jgi:hypothetical protein